MNNNIILLAIPFFTLSVIIESIINYHNKSDYYVLKDTFASLSMGVGNVIMSILTKFITLSFFYLLYNYRIFELSNQWWVWLLILFSDDFTFYWFHRFSHRCRYFWASHVIHHSSTKYNLSTALRQTWTGTISGKFIFWFWLPIIGFHPLMIITMKSINLIYQFWVHTEVINKMPKVFEAIFNTPSNHRVHHGSDSIYIDKNYAGIFIIWDKLFGTFQKEIHRPKYGITHNINTYNPLKVATHEWISILKDIKWENSLINNMKYIFKHPGWSHSDSI